MPHGRPHCSSLKCKCEEQRQKLTYKSFRRRNLHVLVSSAIIVDLSFAFWKFASETLAFDLAQVDSSFSRRYERFWEGSKNDGHVLNRYIKSTI